MLSLKSQSLLMFDVVLSLREILDGFGGTMNFDKNSF